ncbi:hypothetical protein [Saccharothrix stipae]
MLRRTTLQIPIIAALAMASLTATAPAQAEPDVLHVPGEVHLAALGFAGAMGVVHVTRHADGTWSGFDYLGTNHSPQQLVLTVAGGQEHLMFVDYSGLPNRPALHHLVRQADGAWTNVDGPADNIGSTAELVAADVAGELHRIGRNGADGVYRHNVRHADGTWSSTVDVPVPSSSTTSISIAGVGGALHLVVRGGATLPTYVRHADGTWARTSDVPFAPPSGATATGLDTAGVGPDLHAAAVGNDGRLYHAVQRSNGAWTTFHDVASQTGAPGGTVTSTAITGSGDTLHLTATTSEGRLLHTIRLGNGRWLPFGDVQQVTGSPTFGQRGVAIAGS